ncbi:MAG TPA: ferredoxin [Acidimicrobiales bacterium]|nr:ferredoxin [Acidimicrobiales bacterium]
MPWIPRGLREGIVTSRYPRRPDGYGEGFRGTMVVHPGRDGDRRIALTAEACPTEAISVEHGRPRLDRGRCILCGRCAELYPQVFRFDPGFDTSAVRREALVVPAGHEDDDDAVERARTALGRRVKALRRSVHIRHVDAGSDGAEEWEVAALTNPVYDVQRLGIFFTASPRHADLLLATGVGTAGMLDPLRETYDVMPEPKVVIAAGVDAISGGMVGGGYVARGGLTDSLPVDVFVPGSPPTPFGLLHGILLAVGLLPVGTRGGHGPSNARPLVRTERGAHGPVSPEDPPVEAGP